MNINILSKEIDMIKRNEIEILELKSIISERKNLMPMVHPSLHASSVASVMSDPL